MNTTLLLLSLAAAPGQCYPSYYPTYYTPPVTVVKEIVKVHDVAFVAQPVIIPAYFTGYVPPAVVAPTVSPVNATAAAPQAGPQAAAQLTSAAESKLDKVLALLTAQGADLKMLSSRVDALEAAGQGQPPVPQPVPPPQDDPRLSGLSVLQQRCASCHTEGKLFSGRKTTSVALFKPDGKTLAPLSGELIRRVGASVRNRRMPLDPNTLRAVGVRDDEYGAVQDFLDGLRASK